MKETEGATHKQVYDKFKIPESTYFNYLKTPLKFSPHTREYMAEVIGCPADHLHRLARVNKTKYFAFSGLLMLTKRLVVLSFSLLGLLLYSSFWAGQQYLASKSVKNIGANTSYSNDSIVRVNFYKGTGTDIDLSEVGIIYPFHPSIYEYEFIDMISTITGDYIQLNGKITWKIKKKSDTKKIGDFNAIGQLMGGKTALAYKVSEIGTQNEIWVGTVMMFRPDAGPAYGYWLTIHNDDDPSTDILEYQEKFALGTILLKRPLTKDSIE